MAVNKKIPLRKCVVTKEMKPKKELIRVVKNKDGDVFVDVTGKKNGRGAYLSKDIQVIETAEEKNILGHHLQTKIDDDIYVQLKSIVRGEKNE
ncbi:YlxR family protein [Bacillaceae bacterium S4-13-58]